MQGKSPKINKHDKNKGWVFGGERMVINEWLMSSKEGKNRKMNLRTDSCKMNKQDLPIFVSYWMVKISHKVFRVE